MGGVPYEYFTEYTADVEKALQDLRNAEFRAGRYFPNVSFPFAFAEQQSPSVVANFKSIDEAIAAAGANGTRSILDLLTIGEERESSVAARVSDEELMDLYETTTPTREMIESHPPDTDRGEGVYVIIYKDGRPDGLYFGGCSYD